MKNKYMTVDAGWRQMVLFISWALGIVICTAPVWVAWKTAIKEQEKTGKMSFLKGCRATIFGGGTGQVSIYNAGPNLL